MKGTEEKKADGEMRASEREAAMRDRIEARLAELPVMQYAFIEIRDLEFEDRVRYICETECSQYGRSWACPPAVGTVEECKKRCFQYREGFVFTTLSEVPDIQDIEQTLATRGSHEEITRKICGFFKDEGEDVMALSTESCAICKTCTYPNGPCRHPEKMFPCVESYGILVTALAEKYGIEFMNGGNVVTWFSLILLR